MDIHLIFQFLTIFFWVLFLPFLMINKKIIPVNIFYAMLFSSLMIAYSLIREAYRNEFDMSWNTWEWYPTNFIITLTYYLVVKSYSRRHKRVKCWIPKQLKIKK